MAAFSLIELMFVVGIVATLASSAVAQIQTSLDAVRASGAARHVMARLQQARVRAVTRNRDIAVRIAADARGYVMAVYEDGNGNGVIASDIQNGTDPQVGPTERLTDQYPGVDFGTLPGLPGVEGSPPPGTDPIRLGAGNGVTFTPDGTATPGSLYVHGHGQWQFVVRIYGETGRTRILAFNPRTRAWLSR
ncbi:MAG: GspH/FimT family pseudopilin [Vicinamibacterales bacterium]